MREDESKNCCQVDSDGKPIYKTQASLEIEVSITCICISTIHLKFFLCMGPHTVVKVNNIESLDADDDDD